MKEKNRQYSKIPSLQDEAVDFKEAMQLQCTYHQSKLFSINIHIVKYDKQ